MININYNNLDKETQDYLLSISKKDIESKFCKNLKAYAKEYHLNYNEILEEEAIKNLYFFQYVFNI
ncbi:hypothetical protein [Aureibaculum luteum]|uniref:hypothetical protein n=1 Tax=Aureibaculum luteum TaxID=1548456 RepID=UPI000E4BD0B5|nr:hypothetical protein [Aureibaculum luteum]